ncbi:MAG: M28 family peptidase [Chitinophagaceae bacterium]
MAGRGYVAKGHQNAAKHIMRKFRDMGLKPVSADSSFYQNYTFPVVTFLDSVMVSIKKRDLVPGEEFLVDAASSSYRAHKQKVQKVNVGHYADTSDWVTQKRYFNEQKIYFLEGTDSLCKLLHIRPSQLAAQLPKSCYIIPIHGKMTWTVSTKLIPATVLYIQDSVLPKRLRRMSVGIHSELIPADQNANVIGMVRGTAVPDSFIAITAHYDHLGRMGWDATFPGASDNASGTAMMLQLAAYYAKNPQRYSMLFMAFSGEEAGLLGSSFYVEHPLVPLSQMRFLINIDIMGNAEDGITVVNATEFPKEFSLLESLNRKSAHLPQIRARGRAAISDHYPFSEAGVPAFFMYSNGGPGYYHDVFDRPVSLKLTNVDKVMELLKAFVGAVQ